MELSKRIAEHLGWSIEEVRSFSLPSLRAIVDDPKLKEELTNKIRYGNYEILLSK